MSIRPLLRDTAAAGVYVAVVRRPDRPLLRLRGNHMELIPGESAEVPQSLCEILHHTDGLIAREWCEQGVIARRHDLNTREKPFGGTVGSVASLSTMSRSLTLTAPLTASG